MICSVLACVLYPFGLTIAAGALMPSSSAPDQLEWTFSGNFTMRSARDSIKLNNPKVDCGSFTTGGLLSGTLFEEISLVLLLDWWLFLPDLRRPSLCVSTQLGLCLMVLE
ncbi:hypothetical protein Tsubulata_011807 [Turnera subulata]|uniref:Uncharacterized protein n=1 Tax=Turnera subulata TaxID=218843 RepID=A0A9Q0FUJ0_9ROSI|nr:hypothetical protein Tsubulata_011807 [Turnera subulata]